MAAILQISDGTTTINLLKGQGEYGFHLDTWRPQIVGYKGGGTWQQSALSAGRQLVDKQFTNYIDTFNLKANQLDQDALIYELQEIRRLLEKASSYWTTDWQNEPVYLVAKATDETNTRYALIHSASIPEDEQPYSQPFLQPLCASVMDNLTLVIEHGFWTENAPGTGTCVQTGVVQTWCTPPHLEFSQSTSQVDCDDDAGLQELPASTDYEVDGWVYASSSMTSDGRITDKGRWYFGFDSVNGLEAWMDGGIQDALSNSGTDEFSADDTWHYVLMHFDIGTGLIHLAIDGTWVASYPTQQALNAYLVDTTWDLFLGNDAGNNNPWVGKLGWLRISDTHRRTVGVNFTPPPRCSLPSIDGNTLAQWIGAESSGSAIDNQEGTAGRDGVQTDCVFACDCSNTYGNTDGDTCDDEVYIANKQNMANITLIFVDDGGVFGANLQGGALPYNLLPAVPAVNDAVYFGIDTTLADSGPFSSLVFDIGTAQTDITGIDWRYWNGAAWGALTVTDHTETTVSFDTVGVHSVHWTPPANWQTNDPGAGVTGYWVRAAVTAIGAAPTAPTQQNKQVYSIVWPYIDIDSTRVLGDIAALSKIEVHNQSYGVAIGSLETNRVIVGLRSLSRGTNFTAYLNASDEQNPSGVTVALGAGTAYTNDNTAPTGRRATYSPAGVSAQAPQVTFRLDSTISTDFYGRFHVFVRSRQTGGVAGDIGMAFRLDVGDATSTVTLFQTDEIFFSSTATGFVLMDLGLITIPTSVVNTDEVWSVLDLVILLSNTNAAPGDAYIYDLILVPIDEWAGNFIGDFDMTPSYSLEIDSIERPKTHIRANIILESNGQFAAPYKTVSGGLSIFQSNAAQRLWFLTAELSGANQPANPHVAHSIQLFKQQRYLSMRGAR